METRFPKPEELTIEEKACFQVLLSSMEITAKTHNLNQEKQAVLLLDLLQQYNELPKILQYNRISDILLTSHIIALKEAETKILSQEQTHNWMVI